MRVVVEHLAQREGRKQKSAGPASYLRPNTDNDKKKRNLKFRVFIKRTTRLPQTKQKSAGDTKERQRFSEGRAVSCCSMATSRARRSKAPTRAGNGADRARVAVPAGKALASAIAATATKVCRSAGQAACRRCGIARARTCP